MTSIISDMEAALLDSRRRVSVLNSIKAAAESALAHASAATVESARERLRIATSQHAAATAETHRMFRDVAGLCQDLGLECSLAEG